MPGAQEDNVAHQDLVLERRAVAAVRLRKRLLDLTSDARHRPDVGAFKLGDLERGREHVFDERRVLEDLVRRPSELELLDDPTAAVDVEHDSSCRDAKVRVVWRHAGECAQAGVRSDRRAVEGGEAMRMLRSVLEHAIPGAVVERENGQGLEAPPADRHDERVVRLEDLGMPSMLLEPHAHEPESFLGGEQATNEERESRVEIVEELARDS